MPPIIENTKPRTQTTKGPIMVMNVRMQRMNTAICKPKDMAAWRFAKGLSLEIKKMINGTIGIKGAKNQASIE